MLSISRARTSRVNEGIAQKDTVEILQHFLKHLILHFRKMPSDCCVWELDADLMFCLIAKFACPKDFCEISTPPTLPCPAFATVLSYRTDFFSWPLHLTSSPTLQYGSQDYAYVINCSVPNPYQMPEAIGHTLPAKSPTLCLAYLCSLSPLWLWFIFTILTCHGSQSHAWSLLTLSVKVVVTKY